MQDSDAEVRGDAVSALSQMAEHCTEGLAEYHAQVVPALIHVLQDKSATQEQALFALETLCEDLGACRPQRCLRGCMLQCLSLHRAASSWFSLHRVG